MKQSEEKKATDPLQESSCPPSESGGEQCGNDKPGDTPKHGFGDDLD